MGFDYLFMLRVVLKEMCLRPYSYRKDPARPAYQSNQDLHCPLIKSLNTVEHNEVQSNLDSTDGSFTMANSNSFLSPYEIFPKAQENKY